MSKDNGIRTQFSRSHSPIATKTERDALIAARPKPIVRLDLTPGGTTHATVHKSLNTLHENRIREIADKLGKSSERLNQDRVKVFNQGKINADFGRSQ